MARSIVLPLYDHTTDEEVAEILEELHRIGIDGAHVVNAYVPAAAVDDVPPPCGHDGWTAGCARCESDSNLATEIMEARERFPARVEEPEPEAPVLSIELARELQELRARPSIRKLGDDRFEIAGASSESRVLELLRIASAPISGRPGWRRTPDGREWYSADWLGAVS